MACTPSLQSKYSDLRRLTQSYTFRKMLLWWLPLMLLLFAILAYIYYQRIEVDNLRLRNATRIAVHNSAQAIQSRLEWILKDARFLAGSVDSFDADRPELAKFFQSLMKNRLGIYDQIRLLDRQGKELIRVNAADGRAQLVPQEQLQDKSSYYYVQQAQSLQPDQILMSRFDLNVERDQVEKPYKPMIRFITRTYDRSGEAIGFVVLNYLGRDLMALIQKNLPDYADTLDQYWILNEQGYWLQGPKPELEWGFMFAGQQQQTVAFHYPAIWQAIQANPKEGQLMVEDGLLTYISYQERDENLLHSNPEERWLLVDFIQASHLAKRRQGLLNVLMTSYLLVAVISSVLLWLLLRNQAGRWLVKQREKLFLDIMERIPTGVFVLDGQGRPCYMNNMAASIVGDKLKGSFSIKDLPAQCQVYREDSDELYPSEDLPIVKALQGETVTAYDMEIRQGDHRVPIQVTATPIKDANGIITHAVAAFSDIGQLKRQQARIREEETLHRALLDSSIDAIITIDEAGTIIRINPAAEKMFGYTQQELLGSNVKILVPEPHRSLHDDYIHDFLRTGHSKIIGIGREVEAQCKDGRLIPCDLSITEVKLPDKRFFKGILRDISERKRIEQMEKEFIATVSHELRTPLTSISGSLKLLASEASANMEPLAKELLEIASINSDRLIFLVNDILDIEKLESGSMKFDLKPERLPNLVETAVAANRGYAEQHATRIDIIENEVDAVVLVDKHRFLQVLSNLLSNAVKFSPADSPVHVQTSTCGDKVRVTVIDRGRGIPEAFKDQIFKKFAQAEHSDSARKGGTGLGLCIAKGMIERMAGQIGYESELGQGCRFYLELPVYHADLPPKDKPLDQAIEQAQTPRRILICEDDADVSRLLKIMLDKKGFQADVVYNWAQAREALQSRDYAAMTLDLMLPDMHWMALFEELRQNDRTRHLPVIVVSATADEAKFDISGTAINIYDWLSKPIDENRLVQAVSEALVQQKQAKQTPRILFLENDQSQAQKILSLLQNVAQVIVAQSVAEANQYAASGPFNLIILNMNLSDISELMLLQQEPGEVSIPVMVLSETQNEQKILFKVQQISNKSSCSDESFIDTIQRLIHSET